MSKKCTLCGGIAEPCGKNIFGEDVYECTICHEPGHHSRFEDVTLFTEITKSPEALAEKLVYCEEPEQALAKVKETLINFNKEKEMSKWKPSFGERYYFVALSYLEVHSYTWHDDADDNRFYNIGNCFQTEEEATKMLEAIKRLLVSGVIEQENVTKLPRKFAPGDYVWYKKNSLPAIVDTVVYESDETLYIIKYWDLVNCKYAFIQVPEDQLVKGHFRPFSEATFNKNLIGEPVIDRESGSVFLLTAFISSAYRVPVSFLCMGDGSYINRSEANYEEPLVVVHGECMSLTGLYEHYDINGFPCGEFIIEGEEK